MRHLLALTISLGLAFVPATAAADHWSSRGDVARQAHELSDEANDFGRRLHRFAAYDHLMRDAYRFAQDAEHFHRMVENGRSYQHLRTDFSALEEGFFQLRAAFMEAHNQHHVPYVRRAWMALARDYEELALAFGDDGYAPCPYPRW